jgi:DNA-binding transcriptional ArsR family regulator
MRKRNTLDALLPRTRQGILAATLMQPQKAWYASELARRMGVPSSSLQRELLALSGAGILKTYRRGRMKYFQADTESPLYPDLRGLLLKTVGFVDVLADVLKPAAAKVRAAFVYGSIAGAAEQNTSDVDLMVVGTASAVDLALPLRRASSLLGRQINPTFYTPAEFAKKRASNDHFLASVLGKPKLFVIGGEDDLAKALGREPGNGDSHQQVRNR